MMAHPDQDLSPVKRALLEIRELRARLAEVEAAGREPIAIVGAGLRLPGGIDGLDALWRLLADGCDAIGGIPPDRWEQEAWYDADPDTPGKTTTRHGAFIDAIDRFDAAFFGISPREAESMDPQQRIMLETAWHALEDAGIAPGSLAGVAAGVFIGVCNSDYGRMLFAHPERIDPYFSPGNAGSVVAGRISYLLGLQGPSIAIDTACSSSLVALHLAMQSLRGGECSLALAGGINLILSPEMNINFSKGRMMAPDGRCKTFDAAADGYVRGEGSVLVVLKRLRDCTSRDCVLGVLRGSAINQDGHSNGLTAPNGPAQEAVVRAALQSAGISPAQVGYVEAHGTGTSLGDPIEVQALGAVFTDRGAAPPLAIGSIKTNLGHLEAAAGIAGVLKVLLALRHHEIPPHLNLKTLNPHIDWAACPVVVPARRTPWPQIDGRRIAGVSSFGFSGTNAHVVIEAAPTAEPVIAATVERPQHLFALSARDPQALAVLAKACAARVTAADEPLADLCHAACTARSQLPHRGSVRAADRADLVQGLLALAAGREHPALARGTSGGAPRVAFVFTGGGAQSAGMARRLYESAPVFRATFDRAEAVLGPLLGCSLHELIAEPDHVDAALHQTRFGQPAQVAVELALAALWQSWGIVPAAVLGHSLGEYAAACVAGILSLEDALRIVVERTRAVDRLVEAGRMATLFATPERVQAHLDATGSVVVIAAYNGPGQVVVSGPAGAIDAVVSHFEAEGVRVSRLRVAYASHSPLMEPALDPFERALDGVGFQAPRVTFVSNLTGAPAGLDLVGRPGYWREHLRRPVRFADSMKALAALGITHFVEIGPHPVLLGMGVECLGDDTIAWLPSLRREDDDWSVMLTSLQRLHADGAEVDWCGFDAPYPRCAAALPPYPFQRRRHWAEWAGAPHAAAGDPDHVWHSVSAALAAQAERGPIGVDLADYDHKWAALERLTVAHATDLLHAAGLFARAGERATAEQVRARLGAPDTYRHLLRRWLERLVDADALRIDGDAFVAVRALAAPDLTARWADAERALADNTPLLDYVRHCGTLLRDVLSGAQSPLETLFPGGDFALADGLYRRSANMRYINDLAGAAVQAFVGARAIGPLRVLEVGAGTGGTTSALLPLLPPARTRYRYTDVSPFFFERARAEFAAMATLEFSEFDLDRTLPEQGLQAGSVDLVIAANAVHASRDLRAALRRLHELIAPGGLLLLIETTTHQAWFDMTTGLIEGWQHFADDLRSDNPLLAPAQWTQALADAGFVAVGSWPPADSPANAIGQHVVVARVAGEVGGAAELLEPLPPTSMDADASLAPVAAHVRERLAAALPDERIELMREFVREHVVRVLRLDANDPPGRHDRLMDLGFDSLMAVQLRNRLGTGLGLDKPLPATLMFDHPTVDALAVSLLGRLGPPTPGGAATIGAETEHTPGSIDPKAVAAMSDADVEALLLERLEKR